MSGFAGPPERDRGVLVGPGWMQIPPMAPMALDWADAGANQRAALTYIRERYSRSGLSWPWGAELGPPPLPVLRVLRDRAGSWLTAAGICRAVGYLEYPRSPDVLVQLSVGLIRLRGIEVESSTQWIGPTGEGMWMLDLEEQPEWAVKILHKQGWNREMVWRIK